MSLMLLQSFFIWLLAERPLDTLMKQYAGAYADGFEWPQPSLHSDEDDMDETEGEFVLEE